MCFSLCVVLNCTWETRNLISSYMLVTSGRSADSTVESCYWLGATKKNTGLPGLLTNNKLNKIMNWNDFLFWMYKLEKPNVGAWWMDPSMTGARSSSHFPHSAVMKSDWNIQFCARRKNILHNLEVWNNSQRVSLLWWIELSLVGWSSALEISVILYWLLTSI